MSAFRISSVALAALVCLPAMQSAPHLPDAIGVDENYAEALRRDPRTLAAVSGNRPVRTDLVETNPQPSSPDLRAAGLAIRDRDVPKAVALLFQLLEAKPDDPPALYELGIAYFRLQRYGDAAWVLERFLSVAPERIGQTRALGHCYYSLGDPARAKAHYERVLADSPKQAEAWRGLALSEMHLGNPKRALELLDKVIELEPDHAEAWTWKAELLYEADRTQDALTAAEKARDLDRWQPRAWFLLGRILLDLGQEKEGAVAQARYRELSEAADQARSMESHLEYYPHDVSALIRLVEVHRSTGNIPAARAALASLVGQQPTDVELRIFALDVLEGLGDAAGAGAAATAMKQRCRDDWRAWQRLERYYARIGNRLEQAQAGERYRRLKTE